MGGLGDGLLETAGRYCSSALLQDCSTKKLQYCSSTYNRVTSVNSYQLKRNVTVHSSTADPSSAVLWLWAVRDSTGVCGLGSGEQGLRYSRGVQKCRGVKM